MQECLYSDYGFFAKGEVRSSKSGDFLTSPEVSNYFGLFISNWIKENRINSDSNILEVGAGTGSLANQVSKYLCLLYTSPSPRDGILSRMPSSA